MASALRKSPLRAAIGIALLLAGVAALLLLSSPGGDPGSSSGTTANSTGAGPFVKSESASSPFPPLTRNLSAGLTNHQMAGQRIVAGFEGTTVPPVIRSRIKAGLIGGVILFADNLGSDARIRHLTRALQRIRRPDGLRRYPLMIMVDQEGGLVKRLPGAPNASAEQMGRRAPPSPVARELLPASISRRRASTSTSLRCWTWPVPEGSSPTPTAVSAQP